MSEDVPHYCPSCGHSAAESGQCPNDAAALRPKARLGLLGHRVGSYTVVERIGSGGMGEVYRAIQPEIGARVAIKIMRDSVAGNPNVAARALAEARAVNRVASEHVIKILDAGELEGMPYLVMELLDGMSFDALLARHGPFDVSTAAALLDGVLEGLAIAHTEGIVHRDLKPANLFVTREGRVVVLDFGIAKFLDDSLAKVTRSGVAVGTPQYMAPEQIRGRPIDGRADIYAIGLVLFELVTGQRPFPSEATFEMFSRRLSEPPPSLTALRPDLPLAFASVVAKALAQEPEERFATVAAFRSDLRAVAGSTSVDLAALVTADVAPPPPQGTKETRIERADVELSRTAPTVPERRGSSGHAPDAAPEGLQRPTTARRRRSIVPLALAGFAAVGASLAVVAMRRSTPTAGPPRSDRVTGASNDAAGPANIVDTRTADAAVDDVIAAHSQIVQNPSRAARPGSPSILTDAMPSPVTDGRGDHQRRNHLLGKLVSCQGSGIAEVCDDMPDGPIQASQAGFVTTSEGDRQPCFGTGCFNGFNYVAHVEKATIQQPLPAALSEPFAGSELFDHAQSYPSVVAFAMRYADDDVELSQFYLGNVRSDGRGRQAQYKFCSKHRDVRASCFRIDVTATTLAATPIPGGDSSYRAPRCTPKQILEAFARDGRQVDGTSRLAYKGAWLYGDSYRKDFCP